MMKIKIGIIDTLFSKLVRLRTGGVCEWCGKAADFKEMECSHFHSRRKQITRYDPENACGLHVACHRFLGEHPNIHADFFRKRLGSQKYEELNARAMLIVKRTKADKELIKAFLREQIRLLEGR